MSDFVRALARVLKYEGWYSNDPADSGGETLLGITRRDHPDWPGWAMVDDAGGDMDALKTREPQLRQLAADLYKRRYWDRLDLDSVASQALAEKLFDVAVNAGVGRAARFLQRALNAFNLGGTRWPDVEVDGDFGPRTRQALASFLSRDDGDLLANVITGLQCEFYVSLAERNPKLERFIRGWQRRAFNAA